MEKSRRCGICKFDVRRAPRSKHLKIKNHLEKNQDELIYTRMVF